MVGGKIYQYILFCTIPLSGLCLPAEATNALDIHCLFFYIHLSSAKLILIRTMKGKQLQNCLESFEYKLSTKSMSSNCNILFSGWVIHSMLQTAISKFAKLLTICSQTLSWFFAYILNLFSQCRAADLKIWIYMNVLTHSNKSTAHSFQTKTISCTQIGQNQRTYLDWTTSW